MWIFGELIDMFLYHNPCHRIRKPHNWIFKCWLLCKRNNLNVHDFPHKLFSNFRLWLKSKNSLFLYVIFFYKNQWPPTPNSQPLTQQPTIIKCKFLRKKNIQNCCCFSSGEIMGVCKQNSIEGKNENIYNTIVNIYDRLVAWW